MFIADLHEVPWARSQILSRGFECAAPPIHVADEVGALLALDPAWVVLDTYELPGIVHGGVLAAGLDVLTFIDGDPRDRTGTFFIDQNIGAENDVWPLPEGVTRFAGLDYAIIRNEIVRKRPSVPKTESTTTPRVFAFFGGTDAFGAGPVLTQALIDTRVPFDLRVVAARPWSGVVTPKAGQTVTVLPPTRRLADEVLAADLVVSAAGTSSWELLCLGAACAFVCVADNQEVSYDRAIAAGLGFGLGSLDELIINAGPAVASLENALSFPRLRNSMRRRAYNRVDGFGRARVMDDFLETRRRFSGRSKGTHS